VYKALKEPKVQQELRGFKVLLARKVLQDHWGHRVQQDLKVHKVLLVL
jgi:hypothetical protein